MRQYSTGIRRMAVLAIVVGFTVCLAAPAMLHAGGLSPTSTRAVDVPVGRSVLLHFQRMKRVQIVDKPPKVEVVVGSLDDLSIFGLLPGDTIVYVWDRLGMHQIAVTVVACSPAEAVLMDLKALLGPGLTYRVSGDRAVIVEGALPGAEAERAHAIIAASGREGVSIVDLVRGAGEDATGVAGAVAANLARILGDNIEYTVWNNNTLIVRGGIGDQERLAQAHKLLQAITEPSLKIVDLLEYQEAAVQPPVDVISQALGKEFRVWQIAGRVVAVEGSVASPDQLEDLNKILEAFKGQAEIINLVRVGKPDINVAVSALQEILGNKIVVRTLGSEAIAIDGLVPNDAELTRLREIVKSYPVGYKIVDLLRIALPERRQVMIKVRVVDVNRTDLQRLGINWGQLSFNGNEVEFVGQPFLMHAATSALANNGPLGNVFSIGAQIDLLKQNNCARVLSEPNLLVDEGGEANIQIGGEIPIPVAQTGGGGTSGSISVEWKPFGVIMKVQPTILEGSGKINLKVEPEVSSLDFANAVTINGFVLPALRQRKASTTVTMDDQGTLILGGLLQSDQSKNVSKIPVLGDLPVLGQLFRRKEFQRGESELIILVTPQVITGSMPIPPLPAAQGGLLVPPGQPAVTPPKQ